jgi:hypothetical protein
MNTDSQFSEMQDQKTDRSLKKQDDVLKKNFTSTLMFVPMGIEGERSKDQEVKKVLHIWGVKVLDMFYDQQFHNLVLVVIVYVYWIWGLKFWAISGSNKFIFINIYLMEGKSGENSHTQPSGREN